MTIQRLLCTLCFACSVALAADPTPPASIWVTSKTSSSVSMTWYGAGDPDGDIARYRISRDGVEVGTSTTTSWTDSGLQPAKLHVYTVIVEDAGARRSPPGPAMSALTLPAGFADPPAPAGVAITGTAACSATVTWNQVTDVDPITRYLIHVDGALAAAAVTPPATITGLSPTSHSFTVTAEDSQGNHSPPSTAAVATIPADTAPPSAPGAVTLGAITAGTISLSWSAATDNVGIAGYRIAASRNGVAAGEYTTTATTYVLGSENGTPLVPSSSYVLVVSAIDQAGNATAAGAVAASTPADTTAPMTPTAPRVGGVSFNSVTLSWSDDGDDIRVIGWDLRRDGEFLQFCPSSGYTDNNRAAGTNYSYTVVAIDAAGNRSQPSPPLEVTTPSEDIPPPAPIGLQVVARTATTLTFAWSQEPDPGDSGVAAWTVERDGVVVADRITGAPWTDTAPTGLNHTWVVTAIDRCGNRSAPSAPLTLQRGGDLTPPATPAIPTLGAATITSAVVNWTAVGGDAIGYEVLRNGSLVGVATGTTWTDTVRQPATTVAYAVRAYDAAGNRSAVSPSVNSTTPADTTAPSKPAGLVKSAVVANGFTLTWTASTDNHAVASYEVLRAGVQIATVPGPAAVLSGLPVGASAAYTVRAVDASGNRSAVSTALTVATLADTAAPSVPQRPWTTAVASNSVSLAWLASDDGVGVASYEVQRDGAVVGTATGTSFTDASVTDGRVVAYALVAIDAAGNRSAAGATCSVSIPFDPARDRTAPQAPTNLRLVSRTDRSLDIAWDAAVDDRGVASYRVAVDGAQVAAPSGTTATLTGLAPETAVTIVVWAVDGGNNLSLASQPFLTSTLADAAPPTAPAAPVASAISVSTCTLTWQAASDDTGVALYEILDDAGTCLATPSATTAEVAGLAPGATTSLCVRAVDAAGNRSSVSGSVAVTTLPDTVPPGVPTQLAVVRTGPVEAAVSWSPATDNVGVVRYDVRRGGVIVGSTAGTTLLMTGLTPSTTYSCDVRAIDASGGASAYCTAISVTTPPDTQPPGQPEGLAVSAISYTSCTLSWLASSDDAGVTGYRVYRDGVLSTTSAGTSAACTGMQAGHSYVFTVAALDAAGHESAVSAGLPVSTTADDGASPPDRLSIAYRTPTGFRLFWSITGAQSFARVKVNGNEVATTPSDRQDITGLAPGATYVLTVVSVNAAGSEASSLPLSVTMNGDDTAPSSPTNLSYTGLTASGVTLNWTAATDNVGVVSYRIWRDYRDIGTTTGTTFTDGSLLGGTPYTYNVEAIDAAGNIRGGGGVSFTTPADTAAPTAPGQPSVAALTSSSVRLTWTAATDNVRVQRYFLYRDGEYQGAVTGLSWTNTGLVAGQSYSYQVAAQDYANLLSPRSLARIVVPPADTTAPAPPVTPRANSVTTATLTLNWLAVADESAPVTYELRRNGELFAETTAVSVPVGGLVPGETYAFTLVARDAAGNRSAPSAAAQVTMVGDPTPPAMPRGLATGAVTDSTVHLTWQPVADAETGTCSYRIWRDGVEIGSAASAAFDATGLAPSTSYRFAVQAVNAAGGRSPATQGYLVRTQIDQTPPAAPGATVAGHPGPSSATISVGDAADSSAIAYCWIRLGSRFLAQTSTNASATLTGLRPSSFESYEVVAVDRRGNVSPPARLDILQPADSTPPSLPSQLAATSSAPGRVELTWAASTDDGGVGTYIVYRSGVELGRTATTAWSDGSAPAGQRVAYHVKALDVMGNASAMSLGVEVVVAKDEQGPQRVPQPTVTALTCTSVSLAWSASWDESAVTGYLVLRDGVVVAEPAGTAWTDQQRTPGATASYTVVARDADGNRSAPSSPRVVVQPADTLAPQAPTGLSVVEWPATWQTVRWLAAADPGGSGVVRYEVAVDDAVVASVTTTEARLGPFNDPRMRRITVRACDAAGLWSPWSAALALGPAETGPATSPPPWTADTAAPAAPATVTAVLTGPNAAAISWTPASDPSGISGYLVSRVTGGQATCLGWTTAPAWNDLVVPGPSPQAWAVTAVDRFGNASADALSAAITPPADASAPPAPSGVHLVRYDPVSGFVRIAWDPSPAADLRSWWISGLNVQLPPAVTAVDCRYMFANPFALSAIDLNGQSGASSTPIVVPADATPPQPPAALRAVRTDTAVRLDWPAGWTGRMGTLTSLVERDGVLMATLAAQTWTDAAPVPGSTHRYRIRTRDAAGNVSAGGPTADVAIPADTQAPQGLTAAAWSVRSTDAITLVWTPAGDGPGRPAPGYEIERDGLVVARPAAGITTWGESGLPADSAVSYRISAIDAVGNRSSVTVPVRTLPGNLPLPRNLRVAAMAPGADQLTLAWDPPYDVAGLVSYLAAGSQDTATVQAPATTAVVTVPDGEAAAMVTVTGSDGTRSTGTARLSIPPRKHSLLERTAAFDAARWAADASYRATWLASYDPARIWRPAEPGAGIPVLTSVAGRRLATQPGGQVTISVRAAAGAPVQFVCLGNGRFHDTGHGAQAVSAGADGVAAVVLDATYTGDIVILAASPMASGVVRFLVRSQP